MATEQMIAGLCEVPVFYSTTEGQTRRIAKHVAKRLCEAGIESMAIEIASPTADALDWAPVRGAIVGASLHAGTHQRQAAAFVKAHAAELNGVASAFFSVSLSAGSKVAREADAASALAKAFPAAAGWHPDIVACFAGRLAYTQYGFFNRLVMKRIARHEGASTDTSRDHEFTDWGAVNALADGIARKVTAHKSVGAA